MRAISHVCAGRRFPIPALDGDEMTWEEEGTRGVQEPECRSGLRPESSRFSKIGVEPELIF